MIARHRKISGSHAALAAVALFCAGAPPASAETVWPGAGAGFAVATVEIPAGALPPGPAVVELDEPQSVGFSARFAMPSSGPASVRLWSDEKAVGDAEVAVVARAASGSVWRTRIKRPVGRGEVHGNARFLGSADEMAALVNAASGSPGAQTALAGLELGTRAELQAPDCRRLAHARVVVAVLAAGQSPTALLACVARGAAMVIVGGQPEPALDRSRASDVAVPEPVAWGIGVVVRVPAVTGDVGNAIAAVARVELPHELVSGSEFRDSSLITTRSEVPGAWLVLALLALYVIVIGPVGYVVGVRPRRPLLAWSWFPLVALGATLALVIASAAWRSSPTQLIVTRVRVTSPTGVGLEATELELYGNRADRFTVAVSSADDADISRAHRGFRFGTPFSSPAGGLAVTDDRVASRLTFRGLSVGRFVSAGAGFVAPVTGSALRLRHQDGRAVVDNQTDRPIRRVMVVRGRGICRVDGVVPARGVAPLGRCGPLSGDELANDWFLTGVEQIARVTLPVDGYALVAELEAPPAAVVVHPDATVIARHAQIVVGVDATNPVTP